MKAILMMAAAIGLLGGAAAGCGDLELGACAWPGNGGGFGDCENDTTADWCSGALGSFYAGESCSEAGYGAGCTPPLCAPTE